MLRHQLAVLRRQVARPRYSPADRSLLATLARLLRADHDPFNEWTPAQFGVPGTFNVRVVNRLFQAQHPDAVANYLRAELHAFNYCTAQPTVCVGFLAKAEGPSFNVAHGLAEWKLERNLALGHHLSGNGTGVQSQAEWAPEAHALVQYKLGAKAVNLSAVENTVVAASLYRDTALIWS